MTALLALRPGSVPWLLRHELRLGWRGMGKRMARGLLGFAVALSVALHVGAYFVLRMWPPGSEQLVLTMLICAAAWIAISLMLAQAILQSVEALFDRGDLDLLLSSPVATHTVFMVRGLGIVANVGGLFLFLLAPFAHVGLFLGHPQLLGIYPAVPALALATTALGLALTLALVRVLGARRARIVAQVLGTLMGGALAVLSQLPNVISAADLQQLLARLIRWAEPGGPLAPDSPVWFPGRALVGAPLPLLTVALVGVVGFGLVIGLAHHRFLAGTQESVTGSARRIAAAPQRGSVRFKGGLWRSVLVKEWRLIARDPQLIAQTLLQLLYLLPVVLLALRGAGLTVLASVAVMLASSLASSLAWITVAAEDAPDLLGSAPVPPSLLRWPKVLAALVPVWLVVSPLLLVLPTHGLWLTLTFLFCLAGGTVSAGVMQVWYPIQGKRKDLMRRAKGKGPVGMIEILTGMAWAGTAYCLNEVPRYSPLPLLTALLGCSVVWWMGRSRRAEMA
ncbi:hypothetical protein [Pelomonas sp. Root1237]|uniref:hypothetical protein n=1 Tax=Pelomonas sp. Root1237 TaxID=1736434 RepID=UPI0006FF3EC5|nr:hypothetical protein [Pelomonas sp. Root1237]KQV93338.1 hypothetical protein ASC91_28420 [Pelomonas sp. Root1237]